MGLSSPAPSWAARSLLCFCPAWGCLRTLRTSLQYAGTAKPPPLCDSTYKALLLLQQSNLLHRSPITHILYVFLPPACQEKCSSTILSPVHQHPKDLPVTEHFAAVVNFDRQHLPHSELPIVRPAEELQANRAQWSPRLPLPLQHWEALCRSWMELSWQQHDFCQ